MAFTIYELCRNPEVLKKVREEIDVVLGDNEIADASHLGKLEYLEMVVKVRWSMHSITTALTVLTLFYFRSRCENIPRLVVLVDC